MQEVIQASLSVPVLAYFTAPWCNPCKQFGPLLEKIVHQAKGRLRLARIDVDKNPGLAQQFRIQSVPMVYIFVNGQPADAFAGAMTESELKQLLSPFLSTTPEEQDVAVMLTNAATLLADSDFTGAAGIYGLIVQKDPENSEAVAGLAKCHIRLGDITDAEALLATISPAQTRNEHILAAQAMLAIAKSATDSLDIKALKTRLDQDKQDHETRLQLATLLFMDSHYEEAVNELLYIIASDKNWREGAARQKLLEFFEALGIENPVCRQGRRKLSHILFT